jgi:SAM-dependent methyltransferase
MYRPWHQQVEPPPCPDGWKTGPPDFVGIGAQRSGTSWWYDAVLRRHPRVQSSLAGKELHYFDWYVGGEVDPDFVERYHALFPRPDGVITGEWTPRYMADLWSMRLLREAAKDARLLVILRDPVERFRSAAARERWLAGGLMRTRLAVTSDAVWRGSYHQQLQHVFELYPREQVLVLQFERCVADPVGQMEDTCTFLGLEPPPEPPERLGQHRRPSHPKPPMPDWLRADLVSHYRDDVERLVELCPEIDLSLWRNFSEPVKAGPVKPQALASDRERAASADGAGEPDLSVLTKEGVDRWLDSNRDVWKEVRGGLRRWAVRYGRTHREHFEDTAALVADASRAARVRNVVDVGSAPGYLAGLLAAAGLHVSAVDLEPKRVHTVYERLGIETHRADIEIQRIPLEDESVDLVLLCQTLEHLRVDPLRPLREASRILRPGGTVIVSVRRITLAMRLRFLFGSDQLLGDPFADEAGTDAGHAADSRLYSRGQITRMLDHVDLVLERVRFGGGVRFPIPRAKRIAGQLSRVTPRRLQRNVYYVAVKPPAG